jgi:hypothetical protein
LHFIITRKAEGPVFPLQSNRYFSFLLAVVDKKSIVGKDIALAYPSGQMIPESVHIV